MSNTPLKTVFPKDFYWGEGVWYTPARRCEIVSSREIVRGTISPKISATYTAAVSGDVREHFARRCEIFHERAK